MPSSYNLITGPKSTIFPVSGIIHMVYTRERAPEGYLKAWCLVAGLLSEPSTGKILSTVKIPPGYQMKILST